MSYLRCCPHKSGAHKSIEKIQGVYMILSISPPNRSLLEGNEHLAIVHIPGA